MDITLIYFDFPFWRAEVSRIALFMGGIEFNDRRIDSEEFQRVKSNGCLDDGTLIPFGQLPVLIVNGVSVAQTGGIARFCGKLADLYPKDDDFLAAQIDQFIDFQTDIYSLILFSGKDVSEKQKLLNREELVAGELKTKLKMLEDNLSDSGAWSVGSNMSIADLALWRNMGWLVSGTIDGIPKDVLNEFPKIKSICSLVDEHPDVVEWMSRTYPKNYPRGSFK